jgi:beta-barrel assembly-enhancing protease
MGSPVRASVAWCIAVSVLVAACATHAVPPIGAGGRPFRPDDDERALWAKAETEERILREQVRTYDDPSLTAFLAALAERLEPPGLRAAGWAGARLIVLRDPSINAFALPNGHVYLHTGLLSRLENETQLATIVGRELAHVIDRHAFTLSRRGGDGSAVVAMRDRVVAAGAVVGPAAAAILGKGLAFSATAALAGYGEPLERAADAGGVDSLVRAGYDPGAARATFLALDRAASDGGSREVFLHANRTYLARRVEATDELVRGPRAPAPAVTAPARNTDEFAERMRPVVRDNALLDIRAGRFALAQAQLDRVLTLAPGDALAHLYSGDLHRLRAQHARSAEDSAAETRLALGDYGRATEIDPALADPYRELGFLYYARKQTAKAKAAFERYVTLSPNADDAGRIADYVRELDR